MSAQSSLLLDFLFVLCNSYSLFLAVKITSFPSYFPTISPYTWIPFCFLLLCDFFLPAVIISHFAPYLCSKKKFCISRRCHFIPLPVKLLYPSVPILRFYAVFPNPKRNVKNYTVECICWVCYPLPFTVCLGRHKRWH